MAQSDAIPGCVGEGEAAAAASAAGGVEIWSRAVVLVGAALMVDMMVDMTVDIIVETGSRVVVLREVASMVDMTVDMTVDMATAVAAEFPPTIEGVSLQATQ